MHTLNIVVEKLETRTAVEDKKHAIVFLLHYCTGMWHILQILPTAVKKQLRRIVENGKVNKKSVYDLERPACTKREMSELS